ncbi:MAG: AmmeMemoRadiSam system protein B [Spirochaetota bacterium]
MAINSGGLRSHEATHAGIFYPEEPRELRDLVASLLQAAPLPASPAVAILSPHAGFEYTGDLSAQAWKAAVGRTITTLVILAPFHSSTETAIWLPESTRYSGPFGDFPVDRNAVEGLSECGTHYLVNDIPHLEEHSIEVQLPFAAAICPEARLVPVLVGGCSSALVKSLSTGLRLVFGASTSTTLFVVSSDLCFGKDAQESHRESDSYLGRILSGDWAGLAALASSKRSCGAACVAALLSSGFPGRARVLGRHDAASARETDEDLFGEYAAIAFEQPG